MSTITYSICVHYTAVPPVARRGTRNMSIIAYRPDDTEAGAYDLCDYGYGGWRIEHAEGARLENITGLHTDYLWHFRDPADNAVIEALWHKEKGEFRVNLPDMFAELTEREKKAVIYALENRGRNRHDIAYDAAKMLRNDYTVADAVRLVNCICCAMSGKDDVLVENDAVKPGEGLTAIIARGPYNRDAWLMLRLITSREPVNFSKDEHDSYFFAI